MVSFSPTTSKLDKGSARSYQRTKRRYRLNELVQDIKQHLGHSGGISSEDVDSNYLRSLLEKYISDPSDWIQYFNNDRSKNYTRNAIENINHKANIVSPSVSLQVTKSFTNRRSFFWCGTPGKDHQFTIMQTPIVS